LAEYRASRYAQAIAVFDEILRERPEHAGALYYRGLARARQGELDGAIADLQKAGRLDPALPVSLDLGFLYFQKGDRGKARSWLEKAAAETPPGSRAKLLLGILAFEEGSLDEAMELFQQAASTDPDIAPTAEYYRGVIAAKKGRTEEARASFARARESEDEAIARAARGYLQTLVSERAPMPSPARVVPGPLSLYAFAGFEYDSNVFLEDTPIIPEKSDGRFVLGLGAAYRALESTPVNLALGYDLYQSVHFDLTEQNLQGHTGWATIEFGDGPLSGGVDGAYSFYLIEDRTYFQEILGSPFLALAERDLGQLEVYYRARGRDYLGKPFDPARDAINHAAGVRQTFYLGDTDRTLDVGYQHDREDPESRQSGRDFEYSGNEVDVGLRWRLDQLGQIELRYGFRNEDYANFNSRGIEFLLLPNGTVVQTRRERRDDAHWVAAIVSRALGPHVYVQVAYLGRLNDSNIEVFDYDRHIVSTTIGLRF